MVSVRITGAKELLRKLNALPGRVANKLVRRALRAGAKPIVDEANATAPSQVAPYGGQSPTVRLKGTFRVRAGKRNRLEVIVTTPKRSALGISGDDQFYYPALIEYGHGNVKPNPYLRTAHKRKGPEAARLVGANLGPAIEREARS